MAAGRWGVPLEASIHTADCLSIDFDCDIYVECKAFLRVHGDMQVLSLDGQAIVVLDTKEGTPHVR